MGQHRRVRGAPQVHAGEPISVYLSYLQRGPGRLSPQRLRCCAAVCTLARIMPWMRAIMHGRAILAYYGQQDACSQGSDMPHDL